MLKAGVGGVARYLCMLMRLFRAVLPVQIKVASCQHIKINNDEKTVCRYTF